MKWTTQNCIFLPLGLMEILHLSPVELQVGYRVNFSICEHELNRNFQSRQYGLEPALHWNNFLTFC